MKKLTVYFVGALLLVSSFTLTSFKPSTTGPSANGQGSLTVGADQQRRFAFHANTMANGSVQGSGELTYTGGVLKIKFDINCLSVSGNTATMSGTLTSVEGTTAFQTGWNCWFKVVDNGEGFNASPDQMTLLYGSPTLGDCSNAYNLTLNPIDGGNIQVKN